MSALAFLLAGAVFADDHFFKLPGVAIHDIHALPLADILGGSRQNGFLVRVPHANASQHIPPDEVHHTISRLLTHGAQRVFRPAQADSADANTAAIRTFSAILSRLSSLAASTPSGEQQ